MVRKKRCFILFIGDGHGEWKKYRYILNTMQHKGGRKGIDCSLQVGDMGIGFMDKTVDHIDGKAFIKDVPQEHKFIRGNHDNPALCKIHPNYIGDYGFVEKSNIFYISGGFSIDYSRRHKDIDWWWDEQLGEDELNKALTLYKEKKPKIVVSHECPLSLKEEVLTNVWKLEMNSRTEKKLQVMLDIHRPDYWIFGHHHQYYEKEIEGTRFVCLDELIGGKINNCIFEIENLTWEGYK